MALQARCFPQIAEGQVIVLGTTQTVLFVSELLERQGSFSFTIGRATAKTIIAPTETTRTTNDTSVLLRRMRERVPKQA